MQACGKGTNTERPHWFQKALSFLPSNAFTKKKKTVFLFLLLQMASGSGTALIKTTETVGHKMLLNNTNSLKDIVLYAHRYFAGIRSLKERLQEKNPTFFCGMIFFHEGCN